MVRWSQSHPVVGRSKVTPVFPPLVAISLYNTHFGNIRWTSNSLVTIRLINVHFGVMGKKDMRDPWMHIIFFPPYASLMLGIHLSQNWLCRPGWGSRDSRRISDLHSFPPWEVPPLGLSLHRPCPQTEGWGGRDHQYILILSGMWRKLSVKRTGRKVKRQIPPHRYLVTNPPLSAPRLGRWGGWHLQSPCATPTLSTALPSSSSQ